jgi:hypothetical protein
MALLVCQMKLLSTVFMLEPLQRVISRSLPTAFHIKQETLCCCLGSSLYCFVNDSFHYRYVEIPPALIHQLKAPGRLIIPVGPVGGGQWLIQVDKTVDGQIIKTRLESVSYVPLTTLEKQLGIRK